jgi:hypothetical protein
MEDQLNILREKLASKKAASHGMVERLEGNRVSGVFGQISTVQHTQVIRDYGNTAKDLLHLVPGDIDGKTVLEDAERLRKRVESQ